MKDLISSELELEVEELPEEVEDEEGDELTEDPDYEEWNEDDEEGVEAWLNQLLCEDPSIGKPMADAINVFKQSGLKLSDLKRKAVAGAISTIAPYTVMLSISTLLAQPASAFYWNEPDVIYCHPQRGLPAPGCPADTDVLAPVTKPENPAPVVLPTPSPTFPQLPFPHPFTI